MIKKIKVLGLTFVAIFAMSAVAASASAAAEFHSEAESTTLHGVQKTPNVFTVNNRTVECKTAEFNGTQSGTAALTARVHPTYSGCTAFGVDSPWTTTGCDYVFHGNGEVDLVCESGNQMEWLVSGTCLVTIGAQNGLKTVSYSNEGSPSKILMTANITGMKAHVSGSTLICGTNGERTVTYTGSVLFEGSWGSHQVGIRWE